MPDEAAVLAKLIGWAEGERAVRALILTSTRARPEGPVDALSDYDVILALDDPEPYRADDTWTRAYGEPLARWGDESERLGMRTSFRGMVYADGTKIDWSLWPVELLDRVAAAPQLPDQLDVGYRVLLDKDGRTTAWPPPTYRAHIPARPSEEEFRALVEEIWWTATYVAKALGRGELFFAKFCLEHDIRQNPLRQLLEWRVELDHEWSLRPGAYGRGLERLLPADVADELAATYATRDVEETWEALDRALALTRRVGREVADALGFPYPEGHDRLLALLRKVRELPPPKARETSGPSRGESG